MGEIRDNDIYTVNYWVYFIKIIVSTNQLSFVIIYVRKNCQKDFLMV